MRTFFLFALFFLAASFANRQPAYCVFWGDSIMAGNELNHSGSDGLNNTLLRWPRQYAVGANGGFEQNDAQSGATLCNNWGGNGPFEDRLSQVEEYDPAQTGLLFIGYGFNDFSRAMGPPNNLTASQFLAVFIPKLTNAVQYIKTTKGWPAGKIVIVWNYVVDNPPYNVTQAAWETALAAVRNAAASEGVGLLDFHTFWKGRSDKANYTDGDLIHPNENANTIMAANVDALIEYPSSNIIIGTPGPAPTPPTPTPTPPTPTPTPAPIPPGVIPVKGKKLVVW